MGSVLLLSALPADPLLDSSAGPQRLSRGPQRLPNGRQEPIRQQHAALVEQHH